MEKEKAFDKISVPIHDEVSHQAQIKGIYGKLTGSIQFNGKKTEKFLYLGTRQGCLFLLLVQHCTGSSSQCNKKEKNEMEKVKYLYTDDMIA